MVYTITTIYANLENPIVANVPTKYFPAKLRVLKLTPVMPFNVVFYM